MAFILASASPRRRELIEIFHLDQVKIIPSPSEETFTGLDPEETVKRTALSKARAVQPLCDPDDTVLAADTLVFLDGRQLGKPHSREEAFAMLRALSGRTHTVCTGCAVLSGRREACFAESTLVTFRELSDAEIGRYIATGEPMDKAGAYGIQGQGALFITGINGDYYNVVGLPVCALGTCLRQMGILQA